MVDKIERLATEIMKEAKRNGEPITAKAALEMAEMEVKNRAYTKSETPKERPPKPRKIDEEKKYLLGCVEEVFKNIGADIISTKTETAIDFNYGGNHYSIKLTKHRPPK